MRENCDRFARKMYRTTNDTDEIDGFFPSLIPSKLWEAKICNVTTDGPPTHRRHNVKLSRQITFNVRIFANDIVSHYGPNRDWVRCADNSHVVDISPTINWRDASPNRRGRGFSQLELLNYHFCHKWAGPIVVCMRKQLVLHCQRTEVGTLAVNWLWPHWCASTWHRFCIYISTLRCSIDSATEFAANPHNASEPHPTNTLLHHQSKSSYTYRMAFSPSTSSVWTLWMGSRVNRDALCVWM